VFADGFGGAEHIEFVSVFCFLQVNPSLFYGWSPLTWVVALLGAFGGACYISVLVSWVLQIRLGRVGIGRVLFGRR
jgi:hypothetical protein